MKNKIVLFLIIILTVLLLGSCSKTMYEVSFDASDDKSLIVTVKVEKGSLIAEPSPPIKEGYNFVGWLLDGNEFDFNTPVKDNIYLVAHWEEIISEVSATIDELTVTRTDFTLIFKIDDVDKVLNVNSLEGKLTHEETTHISTYSATKIGGEPNTFKITGSNLSPNYEYTIIVTGIVNGESIHLINETFRTKHEGSSSENPIYIESVEQFLNIEKDYNAYYELVADLDFSEVEEYTPIFLSRAFSGTFNGNGKTIKNLNINKRHTYTALFGRNAGTIKNLTIENMHIELSGTGQSSQYISLLAARNTGTLENITVRNSSIKTYFSHTGLVRIGGLASYSESGSKIDDSDVEVTFSVESISRTEYNIGGLAGELNGGSMKGNKVKTNIEITNTTTAYIGGAIGKIDESTINDPVVKESSAELDIDINTNVDRVIANNPIVAISIGGFVGKAMMAKITDAYAKANIVYPTVYNVAIGQSKNDKIALGGFAGSVSNRSEFKNILTDSTIELGSIYEDGTDAIKGFDVFYIGGIAGESFASTHTKNYANYPHIVLFAEEGKYQINPVIGNDHTLADFGGGSVLVDGVYYNKEHVNIEDGNLDSTVLTETDLEDFFDSQYILDIINK